MDVARFLQGDERCLPLRKHLSTLLVKEMRPIIQPFLPSNELSVRKAFYKGLGQILRQKFPLCPFFTCKEDPKRTVRIYLYKFH
jgi:hypothetical protein